jgi:phosphate transport system substrate-binding protein
MHLTAGLIVLAMFATACGGDDNGDDGASGSGGGDSVSGEVIISGSSTVAPISALVAELFQDDNGDVSVTVDGPGTGDGFQLFCEGETDISDASRPIKEEEAAACDEAGIEFIELKIAFDGLTVMTNPANDSVECLTFADLYALIGPESQGVDGWADAQELATELGSTTELPDVDLSINGPGEESGTYDSFIEIALADIAEARVEAGALDEASAESTRPDYQASADDTVIIQGIAGDEGSLGWVGFAFAEEAGDAIKEIEVDGGDGCVAPSAETIADGSYPLSRALYIYVSATAAEENPAVAAYIDHYLGDGVTAVEESGYVPLPDDQLAETQAIWEARTTGTTEG